MGRPFLTPDARRLEDSPSSPKDFFHSHHLQTFSAFARNTVSIDHKDVTSYEHNDVARLWTKLYEAFSSDELSASLQARGIQSPIKERKDVTRAFQSFRDRSKMIHLLRKVDKAATFRFLDLPPELRNLVYTEVLSHHHRVRTSQANCSRTAISTASQQVSNEACGLLNDESLAELTMSLDKTEVTNLNTVGSAYHRFEVFLNGSRLRVLNQGTGCYQIRWPEFLTRACEIKLKLKRGRSSSWPRLAGSEAGIGDRKMNHLLYDLFKMRSTRPRTGKLEVRILSDPHYDELQLHRTLFPVCALSAKFEKTAFTFDGISQNVAVKLLAAMEVYPSLFSLQQDLKLAIAITRFSRSFDKHNQLERFEQVIAPSNIRSRFVWERLNSGVLKLNIDKIDGVVEEVANEPTQILCPGLADMGERLREMRAQRKEQIEITKLSELQG